MTEQQPDTPVDATRSDVAAPADGPDQAAVVLTVVPEPDDGRGTSVSTSLSSQLADLVTAHPGVVRIEPSLMTTVRQLAGGWEPARSVRVEITDRLVDVELDIAAHATHQARRLAHQLQRSVDDTVTAHGLVAGTIAINVLAIER